LISEFLRCNVETARQFASQRCQQSSCRILISETIMAVFLHVARMRLERGMGMLWFIAPPRNANVASTVAQLPAHLAIALSPFCNTQHFHARLSSASPDCGQAFSVYPFLPCHVAMFATIPYLHHHIYRPGFMSSLSYSLQSLASPVIPLPRSLQS
jgi:hypothetical protein